MPYLHAHTEKELLLLASGGNRAAFTELYSAYKDKLYGFSLRLTESPELAKDLTQDVFLKLWDKRSNLGQIENFGGYIFKLAQNQSINAFKRMANETLVLSKMQKEMDLCVDGPEESIYGKEVQNSINDILKKLPPQQKLIFKLSREQGLKHEEIAEQLKISPFTVKNHLVLALHTIREYLSDRLTITGSLVLLILLQGFRK